jgi:formylglycine-generating enzyme required for sulfatase activity
MTMIATKRLVPIWKNLLLAVLAVLSTQVLFAQAPTFNMILIEGGTFKMGNDKGYPNEKPVHEVTLNSFYLSETEVTQDDWEKVMGSNPSVVKGGDLPVTNVNYDEVIEFITKLNAMTNDSYRLPTEAEWEYAAKGGQKSKGYAVSGSDDPSSVAWFRDNSKKEIKSVRRKKKNELGLYDMSGNVWEWTSDFFDPNFYANSPTKNPTGPASGAFRVLRGGSASDAANAMRVSGRFSSFPQVKSGVFGFRLAKNG